MAAFGFRLTSRTGPLTVDDYRARARRALPDMVWAYVDYGAEDLRSREANRTAFDRYMLRAKVLTGNYPTDLGVTVAGQDIAVPVLLAPTGLAGVSHWTGERGAAQAAERAGTISILSTAGSYSIEKVAAATSRDHFFQLYPWTAGDTERHELIASLIVRAQRSGYGALFVTVDVPVVGNREFERKRGMGNPPTLTPARLLDAAMNRSGPLALPAIDGFRPEA